MLSFPFYKQLDKSDCGPTCLKMIAKHYGKLYSNDFLRSKCFITKNGVSAAGLAEGAESIGLRSLGIEADYQTLSHDVPLPCIAHWRQKHFVVVYKVKNDVVYVADPAYGLLKYTKEKFLEGWLYGSANESKEGILLLLEPSPEFYELENPSQKKPMGFGYLLPYFKPHYRVLKQLFLALLLLSIIQLVVPFLTQSIIDYGINYQNTRFIYIILFGQLMLFFSQTFIRIVVDWLLMHMGSRINLSLVSDFLIKIMKLPTTFFDSKLIGDLLNRLDDHRRVEAFLSADTLNMLFSLFSLVVFGGVLAYFNVSIFVFYAIGTTLYIVWVLAFIKKRAMLDYVTFDQLSSSQSKVIELITGMREIKLNNSEKRRRWEYEASQVNLHRTTIKSLTLSQYQRNGGVFISELKNILITFFAAKSVIAGDITLGTMLAIQFIIGQLNNPIRYFINFVESYQRAKIGLERIEDVHTTDNEEINTEDKLHELPNCKTLRCSNVCFQYGATNTPIVLKDLNIEIPEGKVTAIVGASGSGKTTLLKLLLRLYDPTSGSIKIGNTNIHDISIKQWRDQCGAVMQDGFIFSDTIARNITESDPEGIIDRERLKHAVQVANLTEFIESLPAGYNTKLMAGGVSLSGGQNQRILIARAVYKNPDFLFFDEATSALDANNERVIMNNLEEFFQGKTVVIIAHRLSTVQKADQVLVLADGRVHEMGGHAELISKKGAYYGLIKNQLELGS
ncbi:peptidase domain-containing ABC transporter [Hymenobacter sp. BT635]|uniref:Peptidase domain-containing ABC transporter n=1 Tax=Hymenobacter nitidus TaxID=2880929 RepID=A0ABS8AE06_9BACT|nr:peptidase domain-containing ABC transporter [Hymenobacter nitidus]MCB2378641.1 peptidase domain-containing ABC transporter [Hymenobacter nitidus]